MILLTSPDGRTESAALSSLGWIKKDGVGEYNHDFSRVPDGSISRRSVSDGDARAVSERSSHFGDFGEMKKKDKFLLEFIFAENIFGIS